MKPAACSGVDVSIEIYELLLLFNIISPCKMLIFTGISNETTNELTLYAMLCENVKIFYRQELASLFQMQEKLKMCRNSKLNFSSSCFTADISHVKIAWLHLLVFTKQDTLHFGYNVYLLKYYLVKIRQNCFNSFNCSNQTGVKVFKFSFALDK